MQVENGSVEALGSRIVENVGRVLVGKAAEIELCVNALLSRGHILIEDVPGVGKTMLAKSLARSLGCGFERLQFTPDLLPSDVTGVNIYSPSPGSDLHADPARRRDQPRDAQDPVGTPGSDGGEAGDGRWHHLPAAASLPGAGDAEPG
jgi:hypothetical protein